MDVEESCVEVSVTTSPDSPKKEEPNQGQNKEEASASSPNRSSPEPGCPICLGRLENKSFTDSCLHQFCFKCLLEWSKVKAECPLCKQRFKSIIHNVRSIEDYEQYYLSTTSTEGTLFVSQEIFARLDGVPTSNYREPPNYRVRTTAVSSYLDYFVRLEEAISHRVIPPGPSISGGMLWQRRRQRGTSDFRRNIYQQGLWVQRTFDVTGRIRECSPLFYRNNPAQVHRLVPWLNRELNVLLYENSPHIQHVMTRILELITQVPIRSPGFAALIAPYIGRHTEHFIHEFHSFAISPFDLVGYDRHANYVSRSEIPAYEDSSRDSDSDVQVLDEEVRAESPLIQLVDSDSDDCIVLDVPQRSEPEVITLDSEEDDVVQISIQTYQPSQSTSSQPPQSASASTSQPKPSTSRRPRLKRNWLTVNNVQVPTTSAASDVNGCEISISIAHSGRSVSPSVSEASTSSWVPVRRKPTKVKKKKETKRKKKGKSLQPVKQKFSESEDSSPGPVARGRRASVAVLSTSSDSDSEEIKNKQIYKKPLVTPKERKPSLSSISSDSDRLFMATDSGTSSDEQEYKPRLRSVVVKSEPRPVSPAFFSPHSRSESRDYDSPFSPRSYMDQSSRSDSYRSSHSHRSRRANSSSVERYPSKRCKHSRKRSKREKL
nr:E3 protein [Recilia dorsalis]